MPVYLLAKIVKPLSTRHADFTLLNSLRKRPPTWRNAGVFGCVPYAAAPGGLG